MHRHDQHSREESPAALFLREQVGRVKESFAQTRLIATILAELCSMGLEVLVSKRSDRPYRGGSPHWIKMNNRQHQAFARVKESFASPT